MAILTKPPAPKPRTARSLGTETVQLPGVTVSGKTPHPGPPPAPSLNPEISEKDIKRPKHDVNLLDVQYLYRADIEDYEDCPMAAYLPTAEYFSMTYVFERLETSKKAIATAIFNFALSRIRRKEHDKVKQYESYFYPYSVFNFPLRWLSFGKFEEAERFQPVPDAAAQWLNDEFFAEQRLSGMNPTFIRALAPGDPRLDVLDGVKLAADVRAHAKKGTAFVCDYTGSRDTPSGEPDWHLPDTVLEGGIDADDPDSPSTRRRHLPRALAFFYWDAAKDRLMPLAIRLDATDHVYTPRDGKWNWTFAKLCVQTCDGNQHELCAHLGRCHLAMEPFALSTRRMLDEGHAIRLLLMPHTRFMIANNDLGRRILIAKKGAIHELMCGSLSESRQISALSIRNFDFHKASLPREIAAKGVGADAIPRYAYRDDGLLIYGAIKRYVTDYVNTAYKKQEPRDDEQLQYWAKDIAGKGSVTGMPKTIDTKEQLADILATILYIFSAEHCAVNFSQEALGGFVPNIPLAARDSYFELAQRKGSGRMTEHDIARFLPSRYKARKQTETMMILSAYRFDKLGDYSKSFQSLYNMDPQDVFEYFKKPELMDCVDRFRQDLARVEDDIDDNQAAREPFGVDYKFLYPENLLNSVSI